jgi:hypothetical protein
MKKLTNFSIILAVCLGLAIPSEAGRRGGSKRSSGYGYTSSSSLKVKGYTKKNGTYVQPHRRTSSNSSTNDNWSTKGNFNPYTGKKGTKAP